MTNRPKNQRSITLSEGSQWFIEFRSGDTTPAARARFEKWLRTSPEHVQAYLEIAAGWSALPTADPESRLDIESLVKKARASSDDNNVIEITPRRLGKNRRSTAGRIRRAQFAASLALAISLLGIGIWALLPHGRTYSTGVGEQRTLFLADGSTVILNAMTTVRIDMQERKRELTLLRGEAYFHDVDIPSRPFIVRSGNSTVQALGTEFSVDQESNETVVTVVEGQVAVSEVSHRHTGIPKPPRGRRPTPKTFEGSSILLSQGEQVTIRPQSIPVERQVDVSKATAWLNQRIVFSDTPLQTVTERFNAYSTKRLVIADPTLRNLGVSGVYSTADPGTLIGFLQSQPGLRVIELGNEFVVTRNEAH